MITGIYMRVNTSVGIFRLPCVREEVTDCVVDLTFNWIVFEEPVIVYTIQPFAEIVESPSGVIRDEPLANSTELQPGDSMYSIESLECGCFTACLVMINQDILKQIKKYVEGAE